MKIKRLTPELVVRNIKESVDFYTSVLGFELTNSVGEGDLVWANVMWPESEVGFMFMTPESMGEEIVEFKTKSIGGSVVQYIELEGLDELYEKVKGKVEIVAEKHTTFYGSKEFSMKDNSGYVLMFSEKI
ncbi:MAG: VOC family protein [Microgenomates group bacterium]